MPKFHVNDTFTIEGESYFALAGFVVEGEIRPGMVVHVAFNSNLAMTARVDCIEFARREGGREDICLCIRCTEPGELEGWCVLNIGDETLEVTTDDSHQTHKPAHP